MLELMLKTTQNTNKICKTWNKTWNPDCKHYLILPLDWTGPISDLESGYRVLHSELLQSGSSEMHPRCGPTRHIPPMFQKRPLSSSAQRCSSSPSMKTFLFHSWCALLFTPPSWPLVMSAIFALTLAGVANGNMFSWVSGNTRNMVSMMDTPTFTSSTHSLHTPGLSGFSNGGLW